MTSVLAWPDGDWKREAALAADASSPDDAAAPALPSISAREAQFAALVAAHGTHLFRVAYSLLRNPHDAEDAVQDALLKLYRGDAWRAAQNDRAFLARTVWRAALDRLPQPDRRMEDVHALHLAHPAAGPEQAAASTEERMLLRELIDALPGDLRQPLLLSAIDELNSREIAVILAIPEGTVRTRLMRSRTELKERFAAMKGDIR